MNETSKTKVFSIHILKVFFNFGDHGIKRFSGTAMFFVSLSIPDAETSSIPLVGREQCPHGATTRQVKSAVR